MAFVYPTTECEDYRLIRLPRYHRQSEETFLKVGCRRCSVCDEEKMEAKQKKWSSRLREMMLYYQENGDRVLFKTFTVHDYMYPDYKMLKEWLGQTMNALRIRANRAHGKGCLKYWIVLEYGEQTGRIHAHAFFFLKKEVVWAPLHRWLNDYWTGHYRAYVENTKVVNNARMAANYATKYAVKQIGYNRDRMMSSHFGWTEFMKERRKQWLGLEGTEDGCAVWVALEVPDVDEAAAAASTGDVGLIKRAMLKFMNGFRKVGTLRLDRDVLHPFQASVLDYRGDICDWARSKNEGTGMSIMKDTLVWVPDIAKLGYIIQLRSARLWQVFVREAGLPLSMLTLS